MKFIYKTRNLALTALFGAALAMGAPAAMAADTTTPATGDEKPEKPAPYDKDRDEAQYNKDVALLDYYIDFVKGEAAKYEAAYPEQYATVFEPKIEALLKELDAKLEEVKTTYAAAVKNDVIYNSPVTAEFNQGLVAELEVIAAEALKIESAKDYDKIAEVNTSFEAVVDELEAAFEKISEYLLPDQEDDFLFPAQKKAIEDKIEKAKEDLATAIKNAAALGSGTFETPITQNWINEINAEISDYQYSCQARIGRAQNNIDRSNANEKAYNTLTDEAYDAFANAKKYMDAKLGDELTISYEEEKFFKDEPDFEALLEALKAYQAKAEAAAKASKAGNWQSYNGTYDVDEKGNPVSFEEQQDNLKAELGEYVDVSEFRVNNAVAQLQLHNEDAEAIAAMGTSLSDALNAANADMEKKLGEYGLTEEEETFFNAEDVYEGIADQIEKLHEKVVDAYDAATADNWQSYTSPLTAEDAKGVTAITNVDTQIQKYIDLTEVRINKAQAAHQQHDEDMEYIQALDELLANAATAIADKYNELAGDLELSEEDIEEVTDVATFDELQAQIDALRLSMVAEAERAEACNWQKYNQEPSTEEGHEEDPYSTVEENVYELEQAINAYEAAGLKHVENGVPVLRAHEENIAALTGLEDQMMEAVKAAQDLYAEKLQEEIGDANDAFFYDEKDFDAIQAEIDEMRNEVAKAFGEAQEDDLNSYTSPMTEAWLEKVQGEVADFADELIYRVDNAQAQLQLHDEDVELIQALDEELAAVVAQIQENLKEKLGEDDLTEAQEEFFMNQKGYDELAAQLDALRQSVVAAYDKAAEDNWQNYDQEASGVKAQAQALYEKIYEYKDDTEYLANNAQAQMQLHDEDVDMIQTLEASLLAAIDTVRENLKEKLGLEDLTENEEFFFLDEPVVDNLQEELDALRAEVVKAYDAAEAGNWQEYVSPVMDQVTAFDEKIQKYIDDAEYLANNAQAQMQLHEEDVELVSALDEELYNAVVAVQEAMQEKLADEIEITDEAAAFFQDENQFDTLQAQIDALREKVVEAYNRAEANNWQLYDQEVSGVKEAAQALYEEVLAYQDECLFRVNNAQANIQLHGEDADMIFDLEAALQAAFDEVATEADDNIDEDILEGIRDYLVVDGYDAILAKIEALRAAMVNQYDLAAADNWQNYEPQVVPNANEMDEAINQYKEESNVRVLNALASIEAHQYDLDILLPLEEMLGDAIAKLTEETPELFEEGSELVKQYELLSLRIEGYWNAIKDAADKAEADNWQKYESVFADVDVAALYDDVENFVAKAYGDYATINMNKWEADNDAVIALESELMTAIDYVRQLNPDFDVDPDFDAIQAAIDGLRQEMAKAYEEAEAANWATYECPYTEGDIATVEEMIDNMIAHAQGTTAIEGVNAEGEQPMIFSIDGKRLNAPIKGELNIFIYKNRVEKKIVK